MPCLSKEFMQALLEAKTGLTREIGISNFTIPLMEKAIAAVGADHIATSQIELSPYLQSRKVVDWAKAHGIPYHLLHDAGTVRR